jgi:hypothetical protein
MGLLVWMSALVSLFETRQKHCLYIDIGEANMMGLGHQENKNKQKHVN